LKSPFSFDISTSSEGDAGCLDIGLNPPDEQNQAAHKSLICPTGLSDFQKYGRASDGSICIAVRGSEVGARHGSKSTVVKKWIKGGPCGSVRFSGAKRTTGVMPVVDD